METPPASPSLIPGDEYSRLLLATRLSGGVLLLNSVWSAFDAARRIQSCGKILENLLPGGISALSGSMAFLVRWQTALLAAVVISGVTALILVWRSRRLPGVILAAGIGTALLAGFGRWVEAETSGSLQKIIASFQGS